MGKSKRASEREDNFELYTDDVWLEDGEMSRFAKERWSEGPRRRRSQWLRQQLDLASAGGEDELSVFTRIG